MTEKYFAHSVDEHLLNVAEVARQFADKFGSGEWAYLAGLWHELGKGEKLV